MHPQTIPTLVGDIPQQGLQFSMKATRNRAFATTLLRCPIHNESLNWAARCSLNLAVEEIGACKAKRRRKLANVGWL